MGGGGSSVSHLYILPVQQSSSCHVSCTQWCCECGCRKASGVSMRIHRMACQGESYLEFFVKCHARL